MWLGSGDAVAVVQASSCRSHSTLSLGTSICHGCGPKKKEEDPERLVPPPPGGGGLRGPAGLQDGEIILESRGKLSTNKGLYRREAARSGSEDRGRGGSEWWGLKSGDGGCL